MQKIKKLPLLEAKKIAAGEVIERPVNIVKELIENSIDAQADQISLFIEDGGKKLIRIVDNGTGMSNEDAKFCIEPHATSKISKVDDLELLSTFGFRGEALSSIASVSKLSLVTKDSESDIGTKLNVEDGQIKNQESIACNVGTDISVRDLFYNIPARLKFLKKTETEWRKIIDIFTASVFSYKNIHFKLYHNGNLSYNCPPVKDIKNRVAQLWDSSLAQNLIDIEVTNQDPSYKIYGVVSNHQFSFYNRNKIYFFINNRFVRNNELSKNLIKGYAGVLPQGRLPAGVVFIQTDPKNLDVNIHPKKEEVKILFSFKLERKLQELVAKNIKQSFSDQINRSSSVFGAKSLDFVKGASLYSLSKDDLDKKQFNFKSDFKAATVTDHSKDDFWDQVASKEGDEKADLKSSFDNVDALFSSSMGSDLVVDQLFEEKKKNVIQQNILQEQQFNIVGQLKKTYILLEQEDGILYVDQHAAHEAILYETFLNNFKDVSTVKLLFPQVLNFDRSDIEYISSYFDLFKKFGIEVEKFGENEIVITSTPVHLKDVQLKDLVEEVLHNIYEYRKVEDNELYTILSKKLCAQMACKAAVKAGDELSLQKMNQLVADLYKLENRFTCPHGRPTLWSMSVNEIEKKFKRRI